MARRKLYTFGLFLSVFLLAAAGPCQNQGSLYSYGNVSARAYGSQTETAFESLLGRYVDANHWVHYLEWSQNNSDLQALKAVLASMAQADDRSMSPNARKAFYINAYNAMTLDLVLSHFDETLGDSVSPYPGQRSIRNIQNLNAAVWDHFQWMIAGKSRSLNDVENQILRPMGDARIHFSIVCASKGCPPLFEHAFTENTLDSALDQLADDFVNSGRNTRFDTSFGVIHTSQILSWFGRDFNKTFGSVKDFFARYVRVMSASEVKRYDVKFDDYDWTLNQSELQFQPSPAPSATPTPSSHPGSGTETSVEGS